MQHRVMVAGCTLQQTHAHVRSHQSVSNMLLFPPVIAVGTGCCHEQSKSTPNNVTASHLAWHPATHPS